MTSNPTKLQKAILPSETTDLDSESIDIAWLDTDVSLIPVRTPLGCGGPTPYQRSGMCGSIIEQDCKNDPNRLYNARDPYYALKREKFEHREVIFLKAEGLTNKEIAEKLGISAVSVSNIIRQPWAQTQILQIIHENGGNAVARLLQQEALPSIQRLIAERDNDLARPAERIAAADKILDRIYGKPNQPIEHHSSNLDMMSDEELERIARGGTTSTATS